MLILERKHTPETAITTSNKVKMTSPLSPDVPISHHFPKGKQTGPCTCSFLSPRGRGGASGVSPPLAPTGSPDGARPRCPSRWLCVPGGAALRSRRPPRRRRAGLRVGAIAPGSASGSCAPRRPPGLRSPPSCPGGAAASAAGARGPASEPKGQIRFHNKVSSSPQSERRQCRRRPGRGGRWAGAKVASARPGRGPAAGRQLDAPVSQLRDVGAEEPVLPKTNGKRVTARAALRGRLSQCLGRKLLWLPETRAGGGVAHVPSSVRPGLRFEGRPRLRVEGRPSRGPESAATPGQAPATRAFFPEPRPPAPLR